MVVSQTGIQRGTADLPRSLTIMVTGVGAPGTKGTIFALKHNPDNVNLRFVGIDLKADVVGKFWVERFYNAPPPESEDYIAQINEICSKESADVIIPQTTREIGRLANDKERVTAKVAVSDGPAISKANNKLELMKVCEKLGIPCPKYFLVRSLDSLIDKAEELGYPAKAVVVKPPVGFGSRGFRVVRENTSWSTRRFLSEKPTAAEITLDELSKILTRDKHVDFPELLVTEFLPGNEYSVDAFIGEKVSIAIPRLRKEIVNGVSFRTAVEFRSDLSDCTLKAAKDLLLKFAFGFQFKLDYQDVPKVLECNPRVQGTMVASFFTGANIIWWAAREALGYPVESVPTRLRESEFYRFWGGLGTFGKGGDMQLSPEEI